MKEYYVQYATNDGTKTGYFEAVSKEELTKILDKLDILPYVIAVYEEIYL